MYWICTIDFEKEHNSTFDKRYQGTGDWILREPRFKKWFDETNFCGKRKYSDFVVLEHFC